MSCAFRMATSSSIMTNRSPDTIPASSTLDPVDKVDERLELVVLKLGSRVLSPGSAVTEGLLELSSMGMCETSIPQAAK